MASGGAWCSWWGLVGPSTYCKHHLVSLGPDSHPDSRQGEKAVFSTIPRLTGSLAALEELPLACAGGFHSDLDVPVRGPWPWSLHQARLLVQGNCTTQ